VKQIADHDRLEDIEFKISLGARKGGGSVVPENLGADHGEGLALGWVDLAWHDRRPRLILWKLQLSETAPRAGAKEADVLSDLEQRCSKSVELAVSFHNSVVCCKSFKLVRSSDEVVARHLADFRRDVLGKTLESVDTSAYRSATLGEHLETRQGRLNALNAKVELLDVAGEFLAKRQGCSILQVRPANLDDLLEQIALLLQGVAEALERREERLLEVHDGSDVHDGREGIVGGSRHVDVVVGMDGLLAAHLTAEDLNGAVRDDFVGVHVGLGAGARLPDDEREVVDELQVGDLSSGLLDGLPDLGVCPCMVSGSTAGRCGLRTQPELHVDGSSGALQDAKGLDDRRRHAVLRLVDLEVLQRTLRLRTPVAVGGDLELAKSITLCPCRSHVCGRGELAALRGVLCLQWSVARGCGHGQRSAPGLRRPISGHDGRAGFRMCPRRAEARLGCAGLQRRSEHGGGRQSGDERAQREGMGRWMPQLQRGAASPGRVELRICGKGRGSDGHVQRSGGCMAQVDRGSERL
jgi:hypothetical protein